MAETAEGLQHRLKTATSAGVRGRLDRGLARGLIWNSGKLPAGSHCRSRFHGRDLRRPTGHARVAYLTSLGVAEV